MTSPDLRRWSDEKLREDLALLPVLRRTDFVLNEIMTARAELARREG